MKIRSALWKCSAAVLCLAALLFVPGCKDSAPRKNFRSVYELNQPDCRIGGMTGIVALRVAKEKLPDARFLEYNMPADAFTALYNGKVDAVVLDRPTLEYMALEHPDFAVLPENLDVAPISVAAARHNRELMDKVDEFIRIYRTDGTYESMVERWFHTRNAVMPPIPAVSTGDALKIGVTNNNEPLCFIRNGELAGFDAEFSRRLAFYLGKKIEFVELEYDALVPALESGKIDLAVAYMDAMPERWESVLFSENYVDSPIAVLSYHADAASQTPGFWQSCRNGFEKTFLRESRWKLILQGLGTTILITVFAVLIGTVLAVGLCMICRSRLAWAAWLGNRFISLVMGTPTLIILMMLYYVVFARVDISGVVVAILGFALDFSVYASVALRSGIESVPRGQWEAALALGHSPWGAFRRFVLPQAVKTMLPVYRSEVISTLKATSIVGYLAIMDLTRMGDVIRNLTYEAFFPLLAVAVLYFLSAKVLTMALVWVEKRLMPWGKEVNHHA